MIRLFFFTSSVLLLTSYPFIPVIFHLTLNPSPDDAPHPKSLS